MTTGQTILLIILTISSSLHCLFSTIKAMDNSDTEGEENIYLLGLILTCIMLAIAVIGVIRINQLPEDKPKYEEVQETLYKIKR